jgi:hypothetical protein
VAEESVGFAVRWWRVLGGGGVSTDIKVLDAVSVPFQYRPDLSIRNGSKHVVFPKGFDCSRSSKMIG